MVIDGTGAPAARPHRPPLCGYVFGGWFGVLAAVAFVRAAISSEPFGLWGTTMLSLALATLGLTGAGLYKYVTERGDADEL